MKLLLNIIISIVIMICSTSCGTLYLDAIPEPTLTMEIPAEGGQIDFKLVEYVDINDTRFQPGEAIKYYRYRVVEDGVAGEESDNVYGDPSVWIDFEPNNTGCTKEYTIDIKVAEDFVRNVKDLIFGEWQTIWIVTQPSL